MHDCEETVTARELMRRLQQDGWYEVRQIGSHKQFRHDRKPGLVTVPVHGSRDIPKRTLASHFSPGGLEADSGRLEMKTYAVVFERGDEGEEPWAAYVPDLPGCISTGETMDDVRRNIREAIELHVEGLKAEGYPVPEPRCEAGRVRVAA